MLMMTIALLLIGAPRCGADCYARRWLNLHDDGLAKRSRSSTRRAGITAPESIVIADSEATFTRFRENAQDAARYGCHQHFAPADVDGASLSDTTLRFRSDCQHTASGITPKLSNSVRIPPIVSSIPAARFDVAAFCL
ncbi:MAG: hypothetical protein U0694_13795 [Anaerolineae bacterium]